MYLKIITSLLFVFPAAYAISGKMYFHSGVIFLTMFSSLIYHFKNEEKFGRIDTVVSLCLMATNMYFLFLSNFILPYSEIAFLLASVSFYFWHRGHKVRYDLNHSLWHIISVLITLCCIAGYMVSLDFTK